MTGNRYGCAVSVRYGTYWVASSQSGLFKRDLSSGSVLTVVETPHGIAMLTMSIDRNFVLAAGTLSNQPLLSMSARANAIVDTGRATTAVTTCNDGTIVGAGGFWDDLTTYSIDAAGQLTELASVEMPATLDSIACSPNSKFVVAAAEFHQQVFSYALPLLTGTPIQTIDLDVKPASVVFNPANSDVLLLWRNGTLTVQAFDTTTGMIGAVQTSLDLGQTYDSSNHINFMQFAYGKLFVHAQGELRAFDGALNQVSSSTLAAGDQSVVCVSEGTLLFVLSTRITKSICILIYVCVRCGLDIAIWRTE
jgi:hypothetical protein